MKLNYLLINAGDIINDDTLFYKVRAGKSQADQNRINYIKQQADKRGWYFAAWDNKTADFYSQIAKSLNKDVLNLGTMIIDAADMVRHIKQHNNTPGKQQMNDQQISFMMQINPAFFFKQKLSVIQNAESGARSKPKAKVITLECQIN